MGIEVPTEQIIEILVHIVFNGKTRINVGADITSFISYSFSFYLSCTTVMIHIPFLV
jgi:glycopeptide antibiotics resistance protein